MNGWITSRDFGHLVGVTDRQARRIFAQLATGKDWKGNFCIVRPCKGRGGKSGLRYEALLSSLPEHVQNAFRALSVADDTHSDIEPASQPMPKFIAAPNQIATETKRYAALRLIAETEKGTGQRADAIREASHHHDIPMRTIQRWVKRCEDHGWDLDALGRKRPSDTGRKRAWVSRQFDRAFLAAGYSHSDLTELADWTTRMIAGWWQSPVQRAGWKRVLREVLTSLRRECQTRAFDIPDCGFVVSRRRIEELRYHSAVDVMQNDAKRFDDMKPRIRRDNSRFAPMEQIVMDVKPLDCILSRPDGSLAYPKLIGFMDNGTHRLFGRIVLLSKSRFRNSR